MSLLSLSAVRPGVQSLTVIAPLCTVRRPSRRASTTRLASSTDPSSQPAPAAASPRRPAVPRRAVTAPGTPTATSRRTAVCPDVLAPTRPSDERDSPPKNFLRCSSKPPQVR